MYSYEYDSKTGGLILVPRYSDGTLSREPRPVYASELDLLGFDQYWKYDKQNDFPYMWAESNAYYYFGKKVATLKGGNFYTEPEIIIEKEDGKSILQNKKLKAIDINAMVSENQHLLSVLESTTVKKIKDSFEKYQGKLDCFHVAFSGGKDSIVLLQLVRKTLPVRSYIVSFADTGMEVPDTYKLIEETKEDLKKHDIPFFTSESHLNPLDSWKSFGPPSRVLRWCCSVHKSTPQALSLRTITRKPNYHGLAYTGVRHSESAMRATYEYESYGKKQQGQYSFAPVLEWTSAEIWLYIYAHNLQINNAYKKGCSRVGCVCCPMGGGRDHYIKQQIYPQQMEQYLDIIKESDSRTHLSTLTLLTNGGWNGRKSGSYLKDNPDIFREYTKNGVVSIEAKVLRTPWKEWIKPIGDLVQNQDGSYCVQRLDHKFFFTVEEGESPEDGIKVEWREKSSKEDKEISKLLRHVFRRVSYCMSCRTCEVNCKHGCISFETGLKITDCKHCLDCYQIPSGCISYNSLKKPGKVETRMAVLNTLDTHSPKNEWFDGFFSNENFLDSNPLGSKQIYNFIRFLKFADILDSKTRTPFAELVQLLGWNSVTSLGLMLVNLVANNQQFRWYTLNMTTCHEYTQSELFDKLVNQFDQTQDNAKRIVTTLTRFAENAFGTELHWCTHYKEGKEQFYTRTKCVITDPLVVLYALYKFAELNDDHKDFSLDVLMADDEDRAGLSPAAIFGLDRDDLIPILKGLSTNFEDFIYASFTHDLEKIVLRPEKTSADVLELIRSRV